MTTIDHPIFVESIRFIKARLGCTGLDPLQQQVLERLIHSSGDFDLQALLRFSPNACQEGIAAINSGSEILTDTAMAAAAVSPMALRTSNSKVRTVLEWVPEKFVEGNTRTAIGIQHAWQELCNDLFNAPAPIVLIGSAPKALEALLDMVDHGAISPSLIIGMPVGFIGVSESKSRLSKSGLTHILLEGIRGGAGLVAATMNALLRASMISS